MRCHWAAFSRKLALDRAQSLKIESDRRIGVAARGHKLARQRTRRARLAQAIKDPATLTEAVEQAGLTQKLQVTRYPRLALPQNLRKLAHGELTAGAKDDEPQPGRLGHRAQRSQ